ncbi:MAG: tetratricopeptide repeat protein [bacterium]|nr:tetratricopeptide repeat protein [bacterium]
MNKKKDTPKIATLSIMDSCGSFRNLFLAALIILIAVTFLNAETHEDKFFRGIRLGQKEELKAAELHFKNALAINPFYIPARRALDIINDHNDGKVNSVTAAILFEGIEFYRRAEWSSAILEYEKAVKKAPSYYLAHHNLGAACYEDGRSAKALHHQKKSIKINPRYPYSHNNLGLTYDRLNKPLKAIKYYKRAIALDPTYHKAYNNYGAALTALKKYDEAKAMFRKALMVNPNYNLAYSNILRSGYFDKSEIEEMEAARAFSLDELIRQIKKGDWQERKTAIQILSIRRDRKTVPPLLKLMKHPNAQVRVSAAVTLGDMKAVAAVEPLIAFLEDKDWTVRWEIIRALGKIEDPRALDSLHRCLLEDRAYHARAAAAYSLYLLRHPSSLEPLDKALQDRIPAVREVVAWVLADAYDRNGFYKSLMNELENKRIDETNRVADSPQEKLLAKELKTMFLEGDWDRMIKIGDGAVDFLIDSIEKSQPGDHSDSLTDAVICLGYIGNEKAVDALIELLKNGNADIRFYAAEALGKIDGIKNNSKTIPALIQLFADPHWKVTDQAAESLRKITGLYLGDQREEWLKWWQEHQEQ